MQSRRVLPRVRASRANTAQFGLIMKVLLIQWPWIGWGR